LIAFVHKGLSEVKDLSGVPVKTINEKKDDIDVTSVCCFCLILEFDEYV